MHLLATTLAINGKLYSKVKLLAAVLSGAIIEFPEGYVNNPHMAAGEHHAFIQHDGKMVRVVVGAHTTSRKARLISKIVLKKALMDVPAQPDVTPSSSEAVWRNSSSRPSGGYYHREGESQFAQRDTRRG